MAWGFGWKVAILCLPIGGMVGFGASPQTYPKDPAASVSAGDIAYRKANFDQAESLYRQALSLDAKCARALLGLGRIEDLHFRRAAARDHFAAAYRLDPRDPQIIRSYAGVVTNRDDQNTLWRNYIALGGEDRAGLGAALGRIQMNQQLGSREIGTLESPYQAYVLPMKPYCPTARPAGMLLMVTINDAKPLRLIFDTGAEGVVIRGKAAEKLGLEFMGSKEFRGLGEGASVNGRIGLARSLSIGDLRIKNCLVDVSESLPAGDVDGVIGPALLQRFLIRFSATERRLELLPFPDQGGVAAEHPWAASNRTVPSGMEGFTKAVQVGHLLFVKARVDGEASGQFLLDTGAANSVVSRDLAPSAQGGGAAVYGLGGRGDGARMSPVRFQFAREPLVDSDAIAFDLRGMSSQAGVDVSGLIGYRALSQKVLTINYRDGLIDAGR